MSLKIINHNNFLTNYHLWRVVSKLTHHIFYLLCSALTYSNDRKKTLLIVSILMINIKKNIINCFAVLFSPSSHLSQYTASRNTIFISYIRANKVALNFFATSKICFFVFFLQNLICNPFEACKHIITLNIKRGCYLFQ